MNNLLQPGLPAALPADTKQVLTEMQRRLLGLRQEANGTNPFTRQLVNGSTLDFTTTETGVVLNDPAASRVGATTADPGSDYGRSAVLAYELPPIEDPSLLGKVFVSFNVVRQIGNVSNVRADLWVIGITDDSSPLAEHLQADNELGLADRADNLKLQDNIIVSGQHLARTFSDDNAALLLGSYLRTFYEANPDYAGGSFLQVRINPDSGLGAANVGWDISVMEALDETGSNPYTFRQPTLVMQLEAVPTPGTCAVGAIGLVAPCERGIARRPAGRPSRAL
jgi:hypothetical protein